MNICILFGKIISNVEYKFIITKEKIKDKRKDNKKINKLNSKNISICEFKIKLENKSKIIVKAYNEKADYCYKKLYRLIDKKRDINKSLVNVIIVGRINNKSEIEVKEINIL